MTRLHYWYHLHQSRDILTKIPTYLPQDIRRSPTIVINLSTNQAVTDKRKLIPIVLALEYLTGHRGLLTQARCSLATWRLKKGMEIGVKIDLKNHQMWNFLDKLINILLPSLIYFNKFNKISYDKSGNLAIGLQDLLLLPEIDWLRESQHLLTKLGWSTGADIVIIYNYKKSILSPSCQASNLQFNSPLQIKKISQN